ncbi:endo-1,4-beta-xylanase [Sphingopyxis sp. BSNA05]|uniref:endo-1,4-beta-xylanase n=1 Tax=Sphingopyxis sp. BSNA05 TaxID=1236614 RepID=UPI0020B7E900|nr:endo-1,4-beta-xylanase [Sphingopyxis sp. BSNA05]
MRGAVGAGFALGSPCPLLAAPRPDGSLAAIAASRGLSFGSAVSARWLDHDKFAGLIARECDTITTENSLKWKYLEPDRNIREDLPAKALAEFARHRDLDTRGHCFIWNHDERMPAWLVEMTDGLRRGRSRPLTRHMWRHAAYLGRTYPDITSWDVVNEAINPRNGKIRHSALNRLMGERFIDLAFRIMKRKAPRAQLVYNDTISWEASSLHRDALLRLLERLLARNVPVDALGIQSHLGNTLGRPRDETGWRLFLQEIEAMGLDIILTELDCSDRNIDDPDPGRRDAETAAFTRGYLDLTLDFANVKQIITWSLADGVSYMNRPGYPAYKRRADGLALRGHPYDDRLRPKKCTGP